ncbi:MAG: adenosylcobinamide-GDP ribazoletransferase [Halolamina sp.]
MTPTPSPTALRGALAFLTRLPAGSDRAAWDAFAAAPATFPLSAYLLGGAVAAVSGVGSALGLPAPTVVVAAGAALYLLSGVAHLDGVADLGDAAAVHGDAADRVAVLKDSAVGVGAAGAVAGVLLATALGLLAAVAAPLGVAVAAVVAAEVGAKLTMAGVACLGRARHEGLGSTFTEVNDPGDLAGPVAVSLPVVAVPALAEGIDPGVAAAGGLLGAVAGGGLVATRASRALDGVNGDVFGAANEVGRAVGLHAAVALWSLSTHPEVVSWTRL